MPRYWERLQTNYPVFDRDFNEFLGGIRPLAFRRLLLLIVMLEYQRQHGGPVWNRVHEQLDHEPNWEEYVNRVQAKEVAEMLDIHLRTAKDYLLTVRKLALFFLAEPG